MKIILADGKVKFLTHKVEWQEARKQRNAQGQLADVTTNMSREFWSEESKDNFITRLEEREITPTVTEYEQPTQDIIDLVDGKNFSYIDEAMALIDKPNEAKIAELKTQIQATDYKIIKCSEYQLKGLELPYDINALHTERQALRNMINELEILRDFEN